MNRLAAMEAFVRVVDTGSFSAAARQLRIGQPAVSKAVAQLEDRLGVRLLLRSTHGLTPTESGQSFYEHAKRAIEEVEEADLAARGASATLSGRLRLCAAVTFARLHVVPHLPAFLEQHPALDRVVAGWRPLLGPRDFVMTIEPASFGGAIAVAGTAPAERPPCRWLTSSLMILQDGTVTMCGADWDAHAPLGNVRDASIAEIWNGAELARRRRAHDEGRFDEIGPCATCTDWRLADGSGYLNATPR